MNYELAKQLKDAGFRIPILPKGKTYCEEQSIARERMMISGCDRKECIGLHNKVYFPTLSELIEACPKFIDIQMNSTNIHAEFRLNFNGWVDNWVVCYEYNHETTEHVFKCDTPEEAVSRLWLELNKK